MNTTLIIDSFKALDVAIRHSEKVPAALTDVHTRMSEIKFSLGEQPPHAGPALLELSCARPTHAKTGEEFDGVVRLAAARGVRVS